MSETITRHYKSQPVDKEAMLADKDKMRRAVYIFLCYSPEMSATLDQVAQGLGYNRFKCQTRLAELIGRGKVRILPQTVNRSMVYSVVTEKNND